MSKFSERVATLSSEQRRLLEIQLRKKGFATPSVAQTTAASPVDGSSLEQPATEALAAVQSGIGSMHFSLFFFSDDGERTTEGKYELLLASARFADRHGFAAVWTPERHFQDFGGLYPNPSVLSAALAVITERIQIRAGSIALPLHHPLRVAEEWAVVDNLSNGRIGISLASGWHASDFVLSPQAYHQRKEVMFRDLEIIRRLWAGEAITFPGVNETEVAVKVLPRPVQPHLPVWITSAGNPDTWMRAGKIGANVLTGMQGETFESLRKKVDLYRRSRAEHGHDAEAGQVTLMLHTFLGEDNDAVKETVRPALIEYMKVFLKQSENGARRSVERRVDSHTDEENELRAAVAFEYYFKQNALLGTVEKCATMIDNLIGSGIDEVACLIDFGLETRMVLESLRYLNELKELYSQRESR